VRSTWSAAIQHGAPVSALLVRAIERCEARDDTRLSRVMIDLLGGVPAEGDLWVRSRIERSGKQIELVSALERLFAVADCANGIGTTIGTTIDESGAVGAIQQSVLVRPMPGR
jgi:hypothetical protein